MINGKKIAIVNAGGGGKGSCPMGGLDYIHSNRILDLNFDVDVLAGVSQGSLTCSMLAQRDWQMAKRLWSNISNGQVYKRKMSEVNIGWTLLTGRKSFLSNKPLKKLVNKHIYLYHAQVKFYFGSVEIHSGKYIRYSPDRFTSDTDYRKAIISSTAMPGIWPPETKIVTRSATHPAVVDGGIRNTSPLGDVIAEDPDEIWIFHTSPANLDEDPNSDKNAKNTLLRSGEILLNEILKNDIHKFLMVNEMVKQAAEWGKTHTNPKTGRPYKYFKARLFQPDHSLGSPLDFDNDVIMKRWEHGWNVAKRVFENNEYIS